MGAGVGGERWRARASACKLPERLRTTTDGGDPSARTAARVRRKGRQ